jgi:hypothetical protein
MCIKLVIKTNLQYINSPQDDLHDSWYIYNSNSGYEGVTSPSRLANIFPHSINNSRTQSKPILRHLNLLQPDTCKQINSTHYW